jgi:hypothetical protein
MHEQQPHDPHWILADHRNDPGPMVTPPRRAESIRRTTSMEMAYPEGLDGPVTVAGRSRDALTQQAGAAPTVLAQDRLDVQISHDGLLEAFASEPACPESAGWLGRSTLQGFRKSMQAVLQDPARAQRPIVQLIDDLVGCTVISGWVATRWVADPALLARNIEKDVHRLESACIAYAPGAASFGDDDYLRRLHFIAPLQPPDDPHAFHGLQPDTDRTQRRVRRIDAWRDESGAVQIDAMFQDSGVAPGTRRVAIHEYRLRAQAQGPDLRLAQVSTESGQLPHALCRSAPAGLQSLLGLPLERLAREVLLRLPRTAGCTHLNDAMRALAAVPALVGRLPEA